MPSFTLTELFYSSRKILSHVILFLTFSRHIPSFYHYACTTFEERAKEKKNVTVKI